MLASPVDSLAPLVRAALVDVLGEEHADADPVVRPSRFADVQVNVALALGPQVGRPPRELAQALADRLTLSELVASAQASGPGFVNVTFADEWIGAEITRRRSHLGLAMPTASPQVVVIDYSAPNVAKEMHVGHLRTTIVGDCLARVLEHLGHRVVRQNHIGDWGTPFGMLLEHLVEVGEGSPAARLVETDPNAFYQAARARFDTDEDFATRSRARVVALQGGDPPTLRRWQRLVELSGVYFGRVYTALGVSLTHTDLAGESTYNATLPRICRELQDSGLAVESDGALVVFLPGFTGRDDRPVPLFLRKSDGGYGYGTTDLATIRHRVQTLGADRILYVVGVTQSLHLEMVFQTARRAGWLPPGVEVGHVRIGSVLAPDRTILRTRSGAPLRLMSLLEEAVDRAAAHVQQVRPDLTEDERARIARQVGIGAVKYADLSVAHDSDYVFDLDRMLALTGNTGPYLQYATARLRSLLATADVDPRGALEPVSLGHEAERALSLRLLELPSLVETVGRTCEPHRLCGALFELAQAFSTFYEQCPVLRADHATRGSRLTLCALVLRSLEQGLDLLGLDVPERM